MLALPLLALARARAEGLSSAFAGGIFLDPNHATPGSLAGTRALALLAQPPTADGASRDHEVKLFF